MSVIGGWRLNGNLDAWVGPPISVLTGNISFVNDPECGLVAELDGSTGLSTSVAFPALGPTQPHSLLAWIWSTVTGANHYITTSLDLNTGGMGMLVDSLDRLDAVIVGSGTPPSTTTVKDGQWHLAGVTWDGGGTTGGRASVYVDGDFEASGTVTGASWDATTNFFLGCRGDGAGGGSLFWNGRMTDARVYDNELTASEMMAIYKAGPNPGQGVMPRLRYSDLGTGILEKT